MAGEHQLLVHDEGRGREDAAPGDLGDGVDGHDVGVHPVENTDRVLARLTVNEAADAP